MFLAASATPVLAIAQLYGWFSTGAIDSNSNGQADLSVCYDVSLSSNIYINRGDIDQEIEQWHGASLGAFSSLGICNNDGSNIKILQLDNGPCEPGNGIYGETQDLGNTGYASIAVWYNPQCMDDYDWYDADGIDAGKISALAVGLHEVGHALGWNHTTVNNAVMHPGGPDNCSFVSNDITKMAFDDADTYRDRYPGLTDTTASYGPSVICGN